MELQGLLFDRLAENRHVYCIGIRGDDAQYLALCGERAYRIYISLIFRVSLHECGVRRPLELARKGNPHRSGVARAAASCTGGVKRRVLQHIRRKGKGLKSQVVHLRLFASTIDRRREAEARGPTHKTTAVSPRR